MACPKHHPFVAPGCNSVNCAGLWQFVSVGRALWDPSVEVAIQAWFNFPSNHWQFFHWFQMGVGQTTKSKELWLAELQCIETTQDCHYITKCSFIVLEFHFSHLTPQTDVISLHVLDVLKPVKESSSDEENWTSDLGSHIWSSHFHTRTDIW